MEIDQLQVGERLRYLREQQGFSLRALADRSGLSFNTISRIERGESSPTVATLNLLASALNVPLNAFFVDSRIQHTVLVRHDQRVRSSANGVILESLGIGLHDQTMEPFLVSVEPGAGSHDNPIAHAGEEFIYCLEGGLTYKINSEIYQLDPGDSLVFDATQPHCFRNQSDRVVRFLIIFSAVEGRSSVESHYLAR